MALTPIAADLAEAIGNAGCRSVFAYPGTSELTLCEAIARCRSLDLVHAGGDKEAVFLAAGANEFLDGSGVALLHGARGLTNALGALADVRRSEIPVLIIVGMPSTASAPYMPPHGEPSLMNGAGIFARAAFEVTDLHPDGKSGLATLLREALELLLRPPFGPVLLGIPQDVLDVEDRALAVAPTSAVPQRGIARYPLPNTPLLESCVDTMRTSSRTVMLIDDFAIRTETDLRQVSRLSGALRGIVLQLAYRRGPMLFQQLRREQISRFAGMYDPHNADHRQLLRSADLIVTVEDRNMYPRVMGPLPKCPKIALTSNPTATAKNGYLGDDDVLLAGNLGELVSRIIETLNQGEPLEAQPEGGLASTGEQQDGDPEGAELVRALGDSLQSLPQVLVVDDSQMFGGLIAKHYRCLRADRVFGSHGGFVGGGLAKAAGVCSAAERPVVCCVGDQGFLNGVQALAVISEQRLPVLIMLCNNGGSVSLRKQSSFDGLITLGSASGFLDNGELVDYLTIAHGYGVPATRVEWSGSASSVQSLRRAVKSGLEERGPHLVELRLPGDASFWSDVWITKGMESVTYDESVESEPIPSLAQPGASDVP